MRCCFVGEQCQAPHNTQAMKLMLIHDTWKVNRVMRLTLSIMLNVSLVLHQYFQNETATPSLARFFEFDFDAVIHASPHSSIKSTWNKRFLTAAAKFNVKVMIIYL